MAARRSVKKKKPEKGEDRRLGELDVVFSQIEGLIGERYVVKKIDANIQEFQAGNHELAKEEEKRVGKAAAWTGEVLFSALEKDSGDGNTLKKVKYG